MSNSFDCPGCGTPAFTGYCQSCGLREVYVNTTQRLQQLALCNMLLGALLVFTALWLGQLAHNDPEISETIIITKSICSAFGKTLLGLSLVTLMVTVVIRGRSVIRRFVGVNPLVYLLIITSLLLVIFGICLLGLGIGECFTFLDGSFRP